MKLVQSINNINKNRSILLIAYKYPPYAGVGGFRWSKLSKYLARMGHMIHVVTVPWDNLGPNTLTDDVIHKNITIHRIRAGYPNNLKQKKFKNRYLNYIKNNLFSRFIDKYLYWDDEAQNWGKYIIPYCRKNIERENINVVIATGHPFQANYHAAKLKEMIPEVKLIQDYRDPWIQHPHYQSKNSEHHKEVAKKYMVKSLYKADASVFVTNGLREEYEKFVPLKKSCVITNGYDPEVTEHVIHLKQKWRNDKKKDSKIVITHIGNITNGRDIPLRYLLKSDLVNDCLFNFIGSFPGSLLREFNELIDRGIINIFGHMSQEQAFSILKNSDVALQLNADIVPYLVSMKIYEYSALGIPVLSINGGGEIDELIKNNKWGISLNYQNTNFYYLLREGFTKLLTYGPIYPNLKYSFTNLAKEYSDLIND